MVQLLQAVREGLDAYRQLLNPLYRFMLTIACPASSSNYQKLYVANMDQYLDFWNFIAYDYARNWSTVTANQANLFLFTNNLASTLFDTQTRINYYILKGILANKIVLGMPVYSRSFNATSRLGMLFSSVSQGT
jgi:chitinase